MERELLMAAFLVAVVGMSGCVVPSDDRVYCSPASRDVDTCHTLYEPVCGYHSPFIFKTYTNDCVACSDQNVEYYTPGKCLVN